MLAKVKSAQQITALYFSVVAFAIIATHFSLMESTIEDIELLNAQNHLLHAQKAAQKILLESDNTPFSIPPFSRVYVGEKALPNDMLIPDNFPYNTAQEIERNISDSVEYIVMKFKLTLNNKPEDIYIVYLNEIYDTTEKQIFYSQAKQLAISVSLLLLSFIVISRISQRLTRPISSLADVLVTRSPHDLSNIAVPHGLATKELHQLVDSVNQFQARLHDSIERERAFNRYASHELRTPLMVIKGATSLLAHSHEASFVEKQRQRLLSASDEMTDFVSTLLSLTRDEDISQLNSRVLLATELEAIFTTHQHLIAHKSVQHHVVMKEKTAIKMPETAFNILLGNLVKNAFACTEQGAVSMEVSSTAIKVIDTGIGLNSKPRGEEGYGLGLLIARDICHKYGWQLTLNNHRHSGCIAVLTLPQT